MIPEPDRADRYVDQAQAAVGNSGAPALQLGAYEGPLDLLLDLARAQKVDLAQLSITALAAQFAVVVEAALAARTVPLPRLAEWLIMAAWLVALRARLLLPAEAAENVAARREAEDLRRRLADRAAALRLADWLEQRLQLGRDVFGRGVAEPDAGSLPAADVTALLRACLKLLELPERERVYRSNPPPLWRVPEALDRMRRLLPDLPDGASLGRFLPPVGEGPAATLQRRAALASTLMAGLELSREGAVALDQPEGFGEIRVNAARSDAVGAAA
ncbi:segregation/condensation protein A [Siccirubricoccus deserti]|uniref:Segregation and condensation protein A n=1 Tax=Siccirubricoccus deserti TaxID=2013562 RepID=A0A9X0R276_9PROT|nr:segregation/condensation protein A [Siccirubricoccus deserti]MBC4018411.1 segregation/condensation protein A [Siccirubricoccus deserti]GGC65408.1 segregation/condensation protein A [Siccirubricoccus deserti]